MGNNILNKPHSYYYEIHRMIDVDYENATFSIAEGYTIDDVMYKLAYYEKIEQHHSIGDYSIILEKYKIHADNFDEYLRIVDAYKMPIENFLKDVENCNTRMRNALAKAGIERVCDLIDTGPYSSTFSIIHKIPGIGKESHRSIHKALLNLKYKTNFGESEWMKEKSKKSFTKEK